jgi:ribonuclease H2 subunit A
MANECEDEYILGIDEAGRGPVLGPLVYACALWKKSKEEEINSKYGFNDSKKLTDKVRRQLYEKIKEDEDIIYYTSVSTPLEISNSMLRRPNDIINLNELSYNSAVSIMNKAFIAKYNVTEIIADLLGTKSTYEQILKERCLSRKDNLTFHAEDKADSKYKIVSAASIVAKVTRDILLEEWQFAENNKNIEFSKNYGSGYPSDPNTVEWLKGNLNFNAIFGFPSIVRFSWKTIVKILKEKAVKTTFEDYDDEQDGNKRYIFNEINENQTKLFNKKSSNNYFKKMDLVMFNDNDDFSKFN